jgi:hypothetical protein
MFYRLWANALAELHNSALLEGEYAPLEAVYLAFPKIKGVKTIVK